jgi:hypothetical protein
VGGLTDLGTSNELKINFAAIYLVAEFIYVLHLCRPKAKTSSKEMAVKETLIYISCFSCHDLAAYNGKRLMKEVCM